MPEEALHLDGGHEDGLVRQGSQEGISNNDRDWLQRLIFFAVQVPITDFFGSVRNVHLTTDPLKFALDENWLKAADDEVEEREETGDVFAYGHPLPILETL